jgi:predicted nuclease of predicted toxin-antitoxin system
MRILLDENLDWRLRRGLLGHEVESVARLGWAGIQNGILLKKAEETGFEVLITMDSNMTFQQNLAGHPLKIIVLRARSNRLADTIPLTAKILQVLPYLKNGRVTVIE